MDRSRAEVRATYDRIADHFAKTREYAWPEIEAFIAGRSGAVGLDLGCGNGRHAELLAERCDRVVGVDASRGLLSTAQDRATERDFAVDLLAGDAARLPLRDRSVDLAVYVATLHHLPTPETRRASLDELARVLADGGRALISVWATTHDRFDATDSIDTHVDWTLPGGETVPRYYHIYAPEAFVEALAASDLGIRRAWVSSGNCYAVVDPGR